VHRVAAAESFGPVLSVMAFRTLEEAFEPANNSLKAPLEHRWLAR